MKSFFQSISISYLQHLLIFSILISFNSTYAQCPYCPGEGFGIVIPFNYPKSHSFTEDLYFDLEVKLPSCSPEYSGQIYIIRVGGVPGSDLILDSAEILLEPGVPTIITNIRYPSEYLHQDFYYEDSSRYVINVRYPPCNYLDPAPTSKWMSIKMTCPEKQLFAQSENLLTSLHESGNEWYLNNNLISRDYQIRMNTDGVYKLNFINAPGNCTYRDSVIFNGIVEHEDGSLSAFEIENANYTWFLDDEPLSCSSSNHINALANGIYKVIVNYGEEEVEFTKNIDYLSFCYNAGVDNNYISLGCNNYSKHISDNSPLLFDLDINVPSCFPFYSGRAVIVNQDLDHNFLNAIDTVEVNLKGGENYKFSGISFSPNLLNNNTFIADSSLYVINLILIDNVDCQNPQYVDPKANTGSVISCYRENCLSSPLFDISENDLSISYSYEHPFRLFVNGEEPNGITEFALIDGLYKVHMIYAGCHSLDSLPFAGIHFDGSELTTANIDEAEYVWFRNGEIIEDAQNYHYTLKSAGIYEVFITKSISGETSFIANFRIDLSDLIISNTRSEFEPQSFIIRDNVLYFKDTGVSQYTLFNPIGQELISILDLTKTYDLNHLKNGIYILREINVTNFEVRSHKFLIGY
ncbi:MAG: hypothetical protein ACK4ND_16630 [Cytophagaceae bacterium]